MGFRDLLPDRALLEDRRTALGAGRIPTDAFEELHADVPARVAESAPAAVIRAEDGTVLADHKILLALTEDPMPDDGTRITIAAGPFAGRYVQHGAARVRRRATTIHHVSIFARRAT